MIDHIVICLVLTSGLFAKRDHIITSAEGFVQDYDYIDPKDTFFRTYDNYFEKISNEPANLNDIPRPNGFKFNNDFERNINGPGYELKLNRLKRDAEKDDEDKNLRLADETKPDFAKNLGQPLEIAILDPENITTTTTTTTTTPSDNFQSDLQLKNQLYSKDEFQNIGINDFIRFKRDVIEASNGTRPKRKLELAENKSGKMLMEPEESSREPRGATREQWIKQPYPVRTGNNPTDNNYEENASPNDNARAPRVHFVTQRRLDTPYLYRENRESNLDRDFERERYSPRPPQYYNSPSYYPYDRDLYYPRYRYSDPRYESTEYDRKGPSGGKQRRIIYYATLPEVVRTPPNVDLRDRYRYRDRYDDRYVTSHPVSIAEGELYPYRKPYPLSKSRYDYEIDRSKAPYPLKVSTDVNVREPKKNPERRIYAEVDRRYPY